MSLARCAVLAAALSLAAAPAIAQEPAPLVKPGAPGEPSQIVSPAAARALAETGYTEADVLFMQMMIVHHAQAVDMGALIDERSTHEGVRLMGERITISQAFEINMMRDWLTSRGESLEWSGEGMSMMGHMHGGDDDAHDGMAGDMQSHGDHEDHKDHQMNDMHAGHDIQDADEAGEPSDVPVMPGMLSPKQMVELAAAEGADFDYLFLTGMIQHHQGALDMVDWLLAEENGGEEPQLSEFLAAIVSDQSAEILRMQVMLSELDRA